jgi:hypothetical protein
VSVGVGRGTGVDPREYDRASYMSEADLFRGYGVGSTPMPARPVTREERDSEQVRAKIARRPVSETVLLRGRRCRCGAHEPMSDLERRQRALAAATLAAEALEAPRVEFAHPFDYNERAGSSSEPHRISPAPFDSLTLLNGVAASGGQD